MKGGGCHFLPTPKGGGFRGGKWVKMQRSAWKDHAAQEGERMVLPLPPSVNHAYRNALRDGRRMRLRTAEAERYSQDVAWIALAWAKRTGWVVPEAGRKIRMHLWYIWPSNRRMDTHNREKILLDALEGVLYCDDRWVLVQEEDFEVDRAHPRVELRLELNQ